MTLKSTDVRVDYNSEGIAEMTILSGDDAVIRFMYGKVWIDDSNPDEPSLQFGYEILSGEPVDKEAFIKSIAELLHSTILIQLENGEVVYSGGTDKNDAAVDNKLESRMAEFYGEKNDMSQLPTLGRFDSKPKESAMSFLDRLAAEGQAALLEIKGKR
jgi:hypothetical protein